VVARLEERLRGGGFLIVGRHEALPPSACFEPSAAAPGIYRRVS
jgi:chemotaxis methyl-accepting protein methylase